MSQDEKLEKQIEQFQEVAKENKNVDVNMLMVNALQNADQAAKKSGSRKWPYLISIGLPPLGLLFALKYFFFSDEEDATQAGYICIFLTFASLLSVWIFSKLLFSSSGTSLEQIQQIKPSDINQLLQ